MHFAREGVYDYTFYLSLIHRFPPAMCFPVDGDGDGDGDGSSSEDEGDDENKAPAKKKSGFTKPVEVSPALRTLVGDEEISRPGIVKKFWAYVRVRTRSNRDPRLSSCIHTPRPIISHHRSQLIVFCVLGRLVDCITQTIVRTMHT